MQYAIQKLDTNSRMFITLAGRGDSAFYGYSADAKKARTWSASSARRHLRILESIPHTGRFSMIPVVE